MIFPQIFELFNHDRQQISEVYLFSGGVDSGNVLHAFIDNNILIDFNDAFLKIVGVKYKLDLIGKNTSETGLNLLKSEDKSYFLNQIKKNGKFENYYFTFRNMKGELLRGLVSGTIIELNNQKCLLSICQIVYRKCFFQLWIKLFIYRA